MLNSKDIKIIACLQNEFPLSIYPYNQLAKKLRLSPERLLQKTRQYKKQGVIRYIGAVLDLKQIGFKSTLVACAVPSSKIGFAARLINKYSQVTHNYLRDGYYNIWFTLHGSSLTEINSLIREIKRCAGITKALNLPTQKVYKIDAKFHIPGTKQFKKTTGTLKVKRVLCRYNKGELEALNKPLQINKRPFLNMAEKLMVDEHSLFESISRLKQKGIIRRFGAVLAHKKIGFKANCLVAWQVQDRDIGAFVSFVKNIPSITHVYQRKHYENWPFNLYTMIHGLSKKDIHKIIELISLSHCSKIKNHRVLFTVKELKKTKIGNRSINEVEYSCHCGRLRGKSK
jgi:DNA-binding Lrp family transcriptional regulator